MPHGVIQGAWRGLGRRPPQPAAGVHGVAPSALAAGGADGIDVPMRDAEGQPAPRRRRTTGRRTTKWCVTAQDKRGKKAHCVRCMLGFNAGEWRVAGVFQRPVGSASHVGHKWMHLACVDGPLPPASGMEGYTELTAGERESLEAQLEARGGPLLPLLEADQSQTPRRPAQAEAADGGARAALEPLVGPPMPADGPAAYGPGQQYDPMQAAQADPPTPADILQPRLEPPNEAGRDEAENGQDDDYLDDQVEMGDAYHEIAFANLEWWDTVPWERVLLQGAPTTAMIPDSMAAAVSHIKVKICLALEQAHAGWDGMPPQTVERLWKAFVALDGLLFSESVVPSDTTRRERLQERMRWILAGQWDAAWLSMEAQTRKNSGIRGQEDNMGARVRRVTELMRAGETSRAGGAVWPQGDMADAAAVVNKFRTTQVPNPTGEGVAPRPEGRGPAAVPDVNMAAAPGQDGGGGHPRPGGRPGAPELRGRVAAHLKGQFGRYPRRGGAGPALGLQRTGTWAKVERWGW